MQPGSILKIHLDDPGHLLPAAPGDGGAAANAGMRGVNVTFGNPVTQVNLFGRLQSVGVLHRSDKMESGDFLGHDGSR
jgi:hypothetical protein